MAESRILVVDDNAMNLRLFQALLQDAGYAVETATTGHEALQSVDRHRPDLILMDVQLPDTDGLTLTRQLRTRGEHSRTRIVAVTAYALKGDRERALAAGCDGFITKPVDLRTFPQLIADYLAKAT